MGFGEEAVWTGVSVIISFTGMFQASRVVLSIYHVLNES